MTRPFVVRAIALMGLAVAVFLTLGWTPPECTGATRCQSFASSEEHAQFIQARKNEMLIYFAVQYFKRGENRYPATFDELCASPYIPVRCPDLTNPHSGKPVALTAGSPGDVDWGYGVNGPIFGYPFIQNGAVRTTWRTEFGKAPSPRVQAYRDDLQKRGAIADETSTLASLTPAEKAAYFVADYIAGVASRFDLGSATQFPSGFAEFVASADANDPYGYGSVMAGDKLRNDFTGKYATAVSTPSPGDFGYAVPDGQTVRIEAYGEGGRVLYSRTVKLSTRKPTPGPMPKIP